MVTGSRSKVTKRSSRRWASYTRDVVMLLSTVEDVEGSEGMGMGMVCLPGIGNGKRILKRQLPHPKVKKHISKMVF